MLILCSFKLLYPTKVHLNRGNHEQRRLNEKYGFATEVRRKYDKVCEIYINFPFNSYDLSFKFPLYSNSINFP